MRRILHRLVAVSCLVGLLCLSMAEPLGFPSRAEAGWKSKLVGGAVAVGAVNYEIVTAATVAAVVASQTPAYPEAVKLVVYELNKHLIVGMAGFRNGLEKAGNMFPALSMMALILEIDVLEARRFQESSKIVSGRKSSDAEITPPPEDPDGKCKPGFLDPLKIFFSQKGISQNFKNDVGPVEELVEGLRNGTISPSKIPAIRLFRYEGKLFSLDNRRLWAFKQAQVDVPYRMATRKEVDSEWAKFDTETDGERVRVRGKEGC